MPSSTCSRHGSRAKTSGGGNGTWRKNPIAAAGAAAAEQLGEQQQVVVVHPAELLLLRLVALRETLVDRAVGMPPAALEGGLLHEPVQQRPERPVREAVVVVVDLPPPERDRVQVDGEALDAAGHVVAAAVPADPGAADRLEHGLQRSHEAAVGSSPAVSRPRDREPVREGDERQVLGLVAHRSPMPRRN